MRRRRDNNDEIPTDFVEEEYVGNSRINHSDGAPPWLVAAIGMLIIGEVAWFGTKVVNIGEALVKTQTQVDGLERRMDRWEDKYNGK